MLHSPHSTPGAAPISGNALLFSTLASAPFVGVRENAARARGGLDERAGGAGGGAGGLDERSGGAGGGAGGHVKAQDVANTLWV